MGTFPFHLSGLWIEAILLSPRVRAMQQFPNFLNISVLMAHLIDGGDEEFDVPRSASGWCDVIMLLSKGYFAIG